MTRTQISSNFRPQRSKFIFFVTKTPQKPCPLGNKAPVPGLIIWIFRYCDILLLLRCMLVLIMPFWSMFSLQFTQLSSQRALTPKSNGTNLHFVAWRCRPFDIGQLNILSYVGFVLIWILSWAPWSTKEFSSGHCIRIHQEMCFPRF